MNALELLLTKWQYEDPRMRLDNIPDGKIGIERCKPQVLIDRIKNTITMNGDQYAEYLNLCKNEPFIIPYAETHVGNLKIIINNEYR